MRWSSGFSRLELDLQPRRTPSPDRSFVATLSRAGYTERAPQGQATETTMDRRAMLKVGVALATGLASWPRARGAGAARDRVLMYTHSQTYEHAVLKRHGLGLSVAEQIVADLGRRHGFDVTCTKDGRVFTPAGLNQYDLFLFETEGDVTREGLDGQPPMPPEGKSALLAAVAAGKGFVGCHSASDTFVSPGPSNRSQPRAQVDPYIAMLGGEFVSHGAQQKAWAHVVDQRFPGLGAFHDFELMEEWYAMKNFAPDLHVILAQETRGMAGAEYQRPRYPNTWARRHARGRVFYTSLGHREDVWQHPLFQRLLLAGISWAAGRTEADLTPNLKQAAPQADELPAP